MPSKKPAARTIDNRYMPGVAGIDLEQALNYIDLDDVGEKYAYEKYTGARLPYEQGSRPALEEVAHRAIGRKRKAMDKVRALTTYVAQEVPWAGFYRHETGIVLPPDRAMMEEEIICSGYGWCNEQARVLCALTQVVGIPSRLVFASHARKAYGHVIVETLLPEGWMAVDESFGLLFEHKGKPVRASRIYRDKKTRAVWQPIYKQHCKELIDHLGRDHLKIAFDMCLGRDPLDGFSSIGYHNHFVH